MRWEENDIDLGILKKFWGFDTLRLHQEQAVRAAISGRDSLALLPTGGGKSLCYQLSALHLNGTCVVVSPLIALMQDQVESLQRQGIRAVGLYGSLSGDDLVRHFDNLKTGVYQLAYISPERLLNPLVQELMAGLRISLLAVDEAHCISQWGHDFRPAYRNIHLIRESHPETPVMALTATATPDVVRDIEQQLLLRDPIRIQSSFFRPNLHLYVAENEDRNSELLYWLHKIHGSGIVYVGSRKRSEKLAGYLREEGFTARSFHGGMDIGAKKKVLREWLSGQVQTVVATSAFGMGIDKPDVRIVIHYDLPESPENYYQEAGRGGRDGLPSYGILLRNGASIKEQRQQYLDGMADFKRLTEVYRSLVAFLQIPYGEGNGRVYTLDFNAFCLRFDHSPLVVLDALRSLEKHGLLELNTQGQKRSVVRVTSSLAEIRNHIRGNATFERVLEALIRNYGGIIDTPTEINEWMLARLLEMKKSVLAGYLQKLHELKLLNYTGKGSHWKIHWMHPREDLRSLRPIQGYLEKYLEGKRYRVKQMQKLLSPGLRCRQQFIMEYFDQHIEPCGRCDLCEKHGGENSDTTDSMVLHCLGNGQKSSRELQQESGLASEPLLRSIRRLLAKGKLGLTDGNRYFAKK